MAGGPTPAERISALEEHCRLHEAELLYHREKLHKHSSAIQANANDLAVFKAQLVGWAAGFGFASGIIGGLIMRAV